MVQDRLKKATAYGKYPAKEKGCCECDKWTPEHQHHRSIMKDTAKDEDEQRSEQPRAVSTQKEIQAVEKMANTGIPNSPKPIEAWLPPAVDESALQNHKFV